VRRSVPVISVIALFALMIAIGVLREVRADAPAAAVDYTKIVPADLVKNTPKGKIANPYKDTDASIVAQGETLRRDVPTFDQRHLGVWRRR
jgi:hypothetical protein